MTVREHNEGDVVEDSIDYQIIAAIVEKGVEVTDLEIDESGRAVIDKDRHPGLYDWAVNG